MDSSSFQPSGTPPPPGEGPPHGAPPSETPPPAVPPPESGFPPGAPPQPGSPPGGASAEPHPSQFAPPAPGSTWEQIEHVLGTAERAATQIRAEAESHAQREFQEAQRRIEAMTRERVAMVSELTDALIEHATLVATQCEGLIRQLEATTQRLGTPPPQSAPEPRSQFTPTPAPPSLGAWPEQPYAPETGPVPPQQPAPQTAAAPPQQPPAPQAFPTQAEQPTSPPPGSAPQAPAADTHETPVPPPGPGVVPAAGGAPDAAYVMATRLALEGHDRAEIGQQLTAQFGIADPEPVLNRVLGARKLRFHRRG